MAGGHAWQGCMCGGAGACVTGGVHGRGCAWQGHVWPLQIATAADGTYPTGMHSCCTIFSSHYHDVKYN